MRVVVNTVDEFLEALAGASSVFDATVRVSCVRQGLSRESVVFDAVIQASVVVLVNDDSEYILDVGQFCGKDYEDSSQDFSGTEFMKKERQRIVDYATSRGWRVLPVVISD